MSLTEFTSGSLELERHVQRSLMVDRAFFVGIAQALVNQAQIDPGTLCCLKARKQYLPDFQKQKGW